MESQNIKNKQANSEEISLRDLILNVGAWYKYILSKWMVIVALGLFGGALGFGYAYIKKPVYLATTTFVLEDDKGGGGGLGGLAGLASMAGIDLGSRGGGIFQGDNILELYKSRSMLEKTLLSQIEGETGELLIDRYIALNKLKKNWAQRPDLLALRFAAFDSLPVRPKEGSSKVSRLRDSILGEAVKSINMNYLSVSKPDKKLSIIRVDLRSKDELFSESFNNILVRNVNEFYIQTKTKKAIENVSILQKKTDSVRAVMNGDIYSAVAVADATPNLNPTRQVKRIAPAQRAQFSAEANKVVLSELIKNLEMSKIALLKETPLIQIIDQPKYPLEKERTGKAKALIVGGILFGFLAVAFFTLRKLYKNILINE